MTVSAAVAPGRGDGASASRTFQAPCCGDGGGHDRPPQAATDTDAPSQAGRVASRTAALVGAPRVPVPLVVSLRDTQRLARPHARLPLCSRGHNGVHAGLDRQSLGVESGAIKEFQLGRIALARNARPIWFAP